MTALISGLEPAQILNNLTDQRVNLSAIVALHCDVAGRPSPTVLWTKNNQTVVEGSGLPALHCRWFMSAGAATNPVCSAHRRHPEPEQPDSDDSAGEEGGQRPLYLHRLQPPRL